jgi:hypothetical protein
MCKCHPENGKNAAREAGWALESRIHVVGDGAEWIRLQTREVFGDQANCVFSAPISIGTLFGPNPKLLETLFQF